MVEDDDIDKSQFLGPGEDIINEFRLAKPDMSIDRSCDECAGSGRIANDRCQHCKGKGRIWSQWRGDKDKISDIRFAQAQVRNILQYLHETKIITDQNAHDGRTYEIWQEIFQASMTMSKRIRYGELKSELAAQGLSEHGFTLLLQRLPAHHHKAIKMSLFTFQNAHTRFLARRQARAYERAFAHLTELIPPIREELDAIAQKEKANGQN